MKEDTVNKYEIDIKRYLAEVLRQNNVNGIAVEDIYSNMLEYIKDNTAIIIGAFEGEKLLGFIWAYEREVNQERRYHINYFIVNPEERKKGIGTQLINEIYKIAKACKISKIELMVTAKNEEAVSFYAKQDFQVERTLLCKEI